MGRPEDHDSKAPQDSSKEPAHSERSAPEASGASRKIPVDPASGTWMQTHGRDLRFLLIFGLLMGVYYVATTTQTMSDRFFPWYLDITTRASAQTLNLFGYDDVQAVGNDLVGTSGSIAVARGCDAIAPTALFLSAVIASPASVGAKLVAIVAGTTILMVVNLIRIITLFLIAIHWKSAFDVMHLDVWQAAFIILAIVLWGFWASWAGKRRRRRSHAAA